MKQCIVIIALHNKYFPSIILTEPFFDSLAISVLPLLKIEWTDKIKGNSVTHKRKQQDTQFIMG